MNEVDQPGGGTVSFTYDADGNRLTKTVVSGGPVPTQTMVKDVYQAGRIAYETDGAGTTLATFSYDPNGAPESLVVGSDPANGPRYYYVYNTHGDAYLCAYDRRRETAGVGGKCGILRGGRHSMRERTVPRGLSPLLTLTLLVAMTLTACATSSVTRAPASPPASAAPQPTKVAVKAGDTEFCNVVSPAEFTRVSGYRATQVTPGATADSLTQLQEVFCIYTDASDPQQLVEQGTINFERANDAQTAAAVYQKLKQSFTGVSDVPGVGEGAFSGTPGGLGSGAGTGLIVVSGPLLLYLSVGGDSATVTRVTRQLAALVLSRVA